MSLSALHLQTQGETIQGVSIQKESHMIIPLVSQTCQVKIQFTQWVGENELSL
jgi:hypothetical protein